jgi:hypothetical protein
MVMSSLRKGKWFVLSAWLVAAVQLTITGCTTVPQSSVVSWREAVQATKDQSSATFEAVGLLTRKSKLDRIERLPPEQLKQIKESDVAPALPVEALRQWNLALDAMAAYASSVEALISPELPQGIGDSLQRTGEQIGATANVEQLKSDKELSKAIGALGSQIVAASANRKARQVMLQIDPAVRDVTTRMANMLYAAQEKTDAEGKPFVRESGVLLTARVTWDDRVTVVQEKFRDTTAGPERRALAEQYAELLDKQAALEESLMALRRALIDLGAAHTAAAQGRSADLRTLVAVMREDTKLVKDVAESLKKNPQ